MIGEVLSSCDSLLSLPYCDQMQKYTINEVQEKNNDNEMLVKSKVSPQFDNYSHSHFL